MASNEENISIWWRHRDIYVCDERTLSWYTIHLILFDSKQTPGLSFLNLPWLFSPHYAFTGNPYLTTGLSDRPGKVHPPKATKVYMCIINNRVFVDADTRIYPYAVPRATEGPPTAIKCNDCRRLSHSNLWDVVNISLSVPSSQSVAGSLPIYLHNSEYIHTEWYWRLCRESEDGPHCNYVFQCSHDDKIYKFQSALYDLFVCQLIAYVAFWW